MTCLKKMMRNFNKLFYSYFLYALNSVPLIFSGPFLMGYD